MSGRTVGNSERRSSVKQALSSSQPAGPSERQELEAAVDQADVQSLPSERPGSRSTKRMSVSNRTTMQPSTKAPTIGASRRMSSVEVGAQQEVTADLSEHSNDKGTGGPPLEVGPPSMMEPPSDHIAERPTTGNMPRRRMSTALPALSNNSSMGSKSASPDVYDALVSAAKDASDSKKSRKSLRAVANSVKVAGKYSGMLQNAYFINIITPYSYAYDFYLSALAKSATVVVS